MVLLTSLIAGEVAPQDAAASGISNMLRNLGTAVLATVITEREQFHSNIIGQSIALGGEEVRARIVQMTDYFAARDVPDPAAAHQQAIIALGNAVKHQALVIGFGGTFAVLGVVLVAAAIGFQKYALVMGEYLASQKPQSYLAVTGGRWRNISSEFPSIGEHKK
jgi:DHA2 family multidrug resistance protein